MVLDIKIFLLHSLLYQSLVGLAIDVVD